MKKPGIARRILSLLVKLVSVALLMALIAAGSFEAVTYYLTGDFYDMKKAAQETRKAAESNTQEEKKALLDNDNIESTMIYVDSADNTREYIFVRIYDKKTHRLDVVQVPQNAKVRVTPERLKKIQTVLPGVRADLDLHSIAVAFKDDKYGILSDIMEDVTGLDIMGYDAFTEDQIIDILNAGKKVTYHFDDSMSFRNSKGVLKYIDAGDQKLSGDQAAALMSHLDGSTNQESARLERTGTYLQSFIGKVASGDNTKEVVDKYQSSAVSKKDKGVTPDSEIFDKLSEDSIMIRVMQGGEKDGYYNLDAQKVQLQISSLVKQMDGKQSDSSAQSTTEDKEDEKEAADSRDLSIELYNAALFEESIAGDWRAFLQSEGYNITLIDNYKDEGPISKTRIEVKEDGVGEDLLEYFPDADIVIVDSIPTGGDIRIRIGTDYTDVPEINSTQADDSDEDYEEDSDNESYDFDN